MTEEVQCPLITPYTDKLGLSHKTLELLYRVRCHDPEVGPIPIQIAPTIRTITKAGKPLSPRNYQTQSITHMMKMTRYIDGHGVGLGKTLAAICGSAHHIHKRPGTKVLVFGTKSTTYQWKSEYENFSTLKVEVLKDKYNKKKGSEARLEQIENLFNSDIDVLVCKYSSLVGRRRSIEGEFDQDGNPTNPGEKEETSPEVQALVELMKRYGDRLILVLDECQKFKSTTSQNRKMILKIQPYIMAIWAMTATVIQNSLDEFYSIAVAIGIRPFGPMKLFREHFCIYRQVHVGQGRYKDQLEGYKNIKEFKAGMRPFYYGRSQAQVKEPLPKLSTTYHPVDLDKHQAKLILEDIPRGEYILPPMVKKNAHGELYEKERDPDNAMTMLAVTQMIANHPCLLEKHNLKLFLTKALSPKEETLQDLLEGDLAGEKVICFAQPLTSKILTPSGWTTMGEIKIGDAVIDPDGGVGYVEGVYPQGKKEVYRLTTKTGASTESSGDHLWLVQTYTDLHKKTNKWRITTTSKMWGKTFRLNKNGSKHYKFFIPKPIISSLNSIELPVPPYTLGVLLGDGDISRSVTFASLDPEIADRVKNELPGSLKITKYASSISYGISANTPSLKDHRGYNIGNNNVYLTQLRSLKLLGSNSFSKFIPECYFLGSKKDRLALLQGLMDTDGTHNISNNSCHYSTTSYELARGVQSLVRSLGGLSKIDGPYINNFIHNEVKKEGSPHWVVQVRLDFCPFSLPRKAELWSPVAIHNAIKSVDLTNNAAVEMQCIRVSTKRHLYITDDYIVTHNTKFRTWIDRFEGITKAGHFTDRKFLRITGAESEEQREINKQLFQNDPNYNLLFINTAAAEGVNLQSAAHMVLLDVPWSWGVLIQLVGRMVRMASPHSACTLHIIPAKGTVDEYAIDTLKGKGDLFETILGESYSAGVLNDSNDLDLASGMEQVNDDSEFLKLLKAHTKTIKMGDFISGAQIQQAQDEGKDYKMSFEDKGKKKVQKRVSVNEQDFSKWKFD